MPATAAVAKRERAHITRPLKVLVPLIVADLARGDRAGMEAYADAGDKLNEAKSQVAHGYWSAWVSKNFALSQVTARAYMHLARVRKEETEKESGAFVLPRSLRELTGVNRRENRQRKRTAAFRSALREFEPATYAQDQQTRADEVRLHREMAVELIDVGYKALASRFHPDRGGKTEAMARLNRVREELLEVAQTRRFV